MKQSPMRLRQKILITSLGSIILGACAAGPDFTRPKTALSPNDQFINQSTIAGEETMAQWWENIEDPTLNAQINRLLRQNLQLVQVGERVLQARANVTSQQGSFFPSLSANQSTNRSFNPILNNNFFAAGDRQYLTTYQADLSTSWQIDLFGKIRRSVESAKANFNASIFDREALTHSLIAELVQTRVNIATNQALLSLAKDNAKNRENLYEVVKRRYNLGTGNVNASDVYLAENNFNTAQSDVFQFERLITADSYRLDILLGQKPGTIQTANIDFPLLPPPQTLNTCLPADLLDRRPDLRASELRIKAANANIGVAIADLYPNISLGGTIGVSGNSTNNLFTADQLLGSLLGTITTRLFEGGRLRAAIDLRESEARELSAAYSETILNALREVETALNSEDKITSQLTAQNKSLTALTKAEESAQIRYLSGIETLQNYLDIQRQRYQTEQNTLSMQRDLWLNRIELYLALGGDWLGTNDQLSACGVENTKQEEIKI